MVAPYTQILDGRIDSVRHIGAPHNIKYYKTIHVLSNMQYQNTRLNAISSTEPYKIKQVTVNPSLFQFHSNECHLNKNIYN